jgi:hypothetical protein
MRSIRMVITRNAALAMLMVALSTLGPQRASALEQSGGAAPGQACTDCKQTCSDNYPNAGGPRTTCLNLCRDGACKATSGGTTNPVSQPEARLECIPVPLSAQVLQPVSGAIKFCHQAEAPPR